MLLSVIWGGTFPVIKIGLESVNPVLFITLRFWISLIILAPFLRLLRGKKTSTHGCSGLRFDRCTWKCGIGVGFFLFCGYILQTIGMRYTTASRSGFFTSLLVIVAPILALIFKTSKTPAKSLIGVPIAFLGVFFMADPQAGGFNLGDVLSVGCAFAFAAQMISLESVAHKVNDSWALAYIQNVTVAVGALIWCLIEGFEFSFGLEGWMAITYTAIFGSILAGWLQTRYQPEVSAGHASMIFMLEPVFASIFAFILLGETWTIRALWGAILILSAMGWSSFTALKGKGSTSYKDSPAPK